MKGKMKLIQRIMAVALLALLVGSVTGCKSATMGRAFDVARAVVNIAPAVVDDAQQIVTKAKDTFDYAKTNILNAAKGTAEVATK